MKPKEIRSHLKQRVVSKLRKSGFTGKFPHLSRKSDDQVDLVYFNFYPDSGSFCVDISYYGFNGDNTSFGRMPNKVKYPTRLKLLKVNQTKNTWRLGSNDAISDKWFTFGATQKGDVIGQVQTVSQIVHELNDLFDTEARQWWMMMDNKYNAWKYTITGEYFYDW
jgi:hypothetical protein